MKVADSLTGPSVEGIPGVWRCGYGGQGAMGEVAFACNRTPVPTVK